MALLATQSGVATRQGESSLTMIHGLAVRLPADHLEIRAIVVGMTLNAVFARSFCSHPDRVHAAVLRQTTADFRVAIQAFEFHPSGAQVMTFRAAQDSGKGLMCSRQRAGRDLRVSRKGAGDKRQKQKDGEKGPKRKSIGKIRCV